MESLVNEMQHPDSGVEVRIQKHSPTSLISTVMGSDINAWLMKRLNIEKLEAVNMANQLCLHGYFYPFKDSKSLAVKDDSSLYCFQAPRFWPWRQEKAPDQIEHAIYLVKLLMQNKQLEEYENEALEALKKNLRGKWDFITEQAQKDDTAVSDSQEKAFWRVHRPPPGQFSPFETCPFPLRGEQKRTEEDLKREIEITKASIGRNRMEMSKAGESLVAYSETFQDNDPSMKPNSKSNPWVTGDKTLWQLNDAVPTENRVKRWSISIDELLKDPKGLQEFTAFLQKEHSDENIRFWLAVIDLKRSSLSDVPKKVQKIYE